MKACHLSTTMLLVTTMCALLWFHGRIHVLESTNLKACLLHFSAAPHMRLPMEHCKFICAAPMTVSYDMTHSGQIAGAA